ncbi:MAG TPA: ACP S-malonyltransferase [Desulfomonilaceae bacterium]|nr:ACP S-malonyltransferase [Desulfomonilaceae bacterium]
METSANSQQCGPIALMFPGQGSQFPGMAMDLIAEVPAARALLERADDLLGYRLSRIMAGERGDELNRTVHTQPAIFVHSMALFEALMERSFLAPVMAAGHSLGEYSALCAAGVLSFEDALDIIRIRARGMDEAQLPGTCGMAAIIGLSREAVLNFLDECRETQVLEAANFNCPDQVVISGHLEAVNRVIEASKREKRTRAVLLPVSSAFHTPLMDSAREALHMRLEHVSPGRPRFPVVANVTAAAYPPQQSEMRRLLTEQVVRPVLWEDCVRTMRDGGADVFVEIGPGKVLSGLLKRIDRAASAIPISDPASIGAFQGVSA